MGTIARTQLSRSGLLAVFSTASGHRGREERADPLKACGVEPDGRLALVEAHVEVLQVARPMLGQAKPGDPLEGRFQHGEMEDLTHPVGPQWTLAAGHQIPLAGVEHDPVGVAGALHPVRVLPPPIADPDPRLLPNGAGERAEVRERVGARVPADQIEMEPLLDDRSRCDQVGGKRGGQLSCALATAEPSPSSPAGPDSPVRESPLASPAVSPVSRVLKPSRSRYPPPGPPWATSGMPAAWRAAVSQ